MLNMKNLIWLLAVVALLGACRQKNNDSETLSGGSESLKVELEDFMRDSDGISRVSGDSGATLVRSEAAPASIELEVEIPVAGRYRVEVLASNESDSLTTIWLEDYIDNKDGRTYDVTGKMKLESGAAMTKLAKEGSPFNAGKHLMRLHLGEGPIAVDYLSFTLMKTHKPSPDTLIQDMAGEKWSLVWSDEFNGEGLPDETKWTYDIGNWGWGNNELQYYTEERLENARQEDGNLIIEARKNDMGEDWTSARLTTRGKVSFVYGKIEIRAKVPPGRGSWAAGWTLGDAYVDELSWPYCGEIDILESVGYEMDDETGAGQAHATIHCGAYYFKIGNQVSGIVPVERMYQDFHTYAIEWTAEGIRAFVDGQQYFEYTDTSTPLSWPYSEPQNLILNLAMGGGWGGAMGMDESIESQQYIVDYVRVYELK